MGKLIISKPPVYKYHANCKSIFLAGTIDMGNSRDWQAELTHEIGRSAVMYDSDTVVYNPRRDSWDSSWKQGIDEPEFNGQVNWEMDMIERSDVVLLFFADGSQSPISLLELGIVSQSKPSQTVVCCEPKFWRRGNVEVVCDRAGIAITDNLHTAWVHARNKLYGGRPIPTY